MARGKDFPLSITLRTLDRATPGLKRLNDQLEKTFKPATEFGKELGKLRGNLGLDKIAAGFKGIGSQISGLVRGAGIFAAAGTGAVVAFKGLADEFDGLGDKAEAIGVSVDFLASMRYAAGQTGGEIDSLDSSLESFQKGLGQAKAGTGRFASFLKRVSPVLLKQVKAAGSTEEALGLMADAMVRIEDPAKRTALAMAAGFDPALIPLLAQGSKGIGALRSEFLRTAGSQEEAARAAGDVDKQMKLMGASIQGVKASLVVGLGPAFADLTTKFTGWVTEHRTQIAAWAADFGQKLPGRIAALVDALRGIRDAVVPIVTTFGSMVQAVGGAENAVKLLVGGFVAFKAIQIGSSVVQIVGGLAKIATAANAARVALLASNAAAAGGSAAAGVGARVGAAALGAGALAAGAAAVAGAGAVGYGVGTLIDKGVGAATGRSLSDRLAGVEGDYIDPAYARHKARMRAKRAAQRANLGAAGVPMGPAAAARTFGPPAPSEAKVTIELKNAPPGTRATTDPSSTAEVDMSVGYQMAGR